MTTNTSSPHDAAARRRFEQLLSRVLRPQLQAGWDEQESFFIQADIEGEMKKEDDNRRAMGLPPKEESR